MKLLTIIVTLIFFLCPLLVQAQTAEQLKEVSITNLVKSSDSIAVYEPFVEKVFINLPDSILGVLRPSQRMDMIDYYHAGSDRQTRNSLHGFSHIEALTNTYMKVRLTDVSTLEIKTMPSRKYNEIAVLIYTVDGPASDSEIFFFDNSMNKLKADKIFSIPHLHDFFKIPKGCITTMKEIEEMIPFLSVVYTLSSDSDNISGRLTSGEYISIDDYNIIKLFLTPKIIWTWNGSRFNIVSK